MNARTLWTRTALVTLGRASVTGAQVIAALLLVRLVSPAGWTQLALLLSVYMAGLAFGHLGLPSTAVFFIARAGAGERDAVIRRTSALLVAAAAATALLVLALRPFVSADPVVATAWPWLAAALLLELPTLGLPAMLVALDRPGPAALVEGLSSVAQVGALVTPVLLGGGVVAACQGLAAYALGRALASAVLTWRLMDARAPAGAWATRAGLRAQLAYTAPLVLALGANVLNRSIDKWLVYALAPASFGRYAVAATEVPLLSVATYAIGAVMAARLARAFAAGRVDEVRALWLAQTSRMTLLVVPLSAALVVAAAPLMELAFTPAYRDAAPAFQLFAGVTALRVAEYGLILRAGGDTRSLWSSSLVLLAGNAVLVPPLVLVLGAGGAALGILLANLVAWIFILRRIARLLRTPLAEVLPWQLYAGTAVLCAAWVLVVDRSARRALPPGTSAALELGVRLGGFAAGYLAGATLLRLRRLVTPLPQ